METCLVTAQAPSARAVRLCHGRAAQSVYYHGRGQAKKRECHGTNAASEAIHWLLQPKIGIGSILALEFTSRRHCVRRTRMPGAGRMVKVLPGTWYLIPGT